MSSKKSILKNWDLKKYLKKIRVKKNLKKWALKRIFKTKRKKILKTETLKWRSLILALCPFGLLAARRDWLRTLPMFQRPRKNLNYENLRKKNKKWASPEIYAKEMTRLLSSSYVPFATMYWFRAKYSINYLNTS